MTWCINMIPWDNESLMLDLKIKVTIFHGSVILPYILKTFLMYKHDTLD